MSPFKACILPILILDKSHFIKVCFDVICHICPENRIKHKVASDNSQQWSNTLIAASWIIPWPTIPWWHLPSRNCLSLWLSRFENGQNPLQEIKRWNISTRFLWLYKYIPTHVRVCTFMVNLSNLINRLSTKSPVFWFVHFQISLYQWNGRTIQLCMTYKIYCPFVALRILVWNFAKVFL